MRRLLFVNDEYVPASRRPKSVAALAAIPGQTRCRLEMPVSGKSGGATGICAATTVGSGVGDGVAVLVGRGVRVGVGVGRWTVVKTGTATEVVRPSTRL